MKKLFIALCIAGAAFFSGCSVLTKPINNGLYLTPVAASIFQAITLAIMLTGLLSLFTFIIPGLTIIWLAALVNGLLIGFNLTGLLIFILITLLMIFGNVVDQILMGAKAKQSGASWTGVILSTIAAFAGSFLAPPFGGIVSALVVLFIFEFIRLRDFKKAGGTTKEMAVGCASAVMARFAIGLVMIALWMLWVWLSGKWPF